jgi:hypothetical protein
MTIHIHVELHALVVVNVLANFFNFITQIHVFIWFPWIYLFIFFVCLWPFFCGEGGEGGLGNE